MESFQETTNDMGLVSHDSSTSLDEGSDDENDKSIAKGGVTTP
jgi:hypothetical protein